MKTKQQEKLSFFEAIAMTTGFTVGAGIITFTGIAIGLTGRSVILTFFTSAILFILAMLPLIITSSVLPRQSASYFYSKELIGEEIGGLYVYIYFLGRITIAVFGISFAQYMLTLIPGIPFALCAVSVTVLFFLINLRGIKAAAKVQNVLFVVLLIALGCFIGFGIPKIQPNYFAGESFFTNGFSGFYSACSMLFFAVGGSVILTEFATKVENPQKNVPIVILLVTLIVAVVYTGLGMVAAGVLPVEEVANKPLSFVAMQIFPTQGLYTFFICGGALGALVTTLNSSYVWYSNALIGACEEGWLPKALGKKNKYGAPYRMLALFMLFGILAPIIGMDIAVLSKLAVGLTIFSFIIPQAAILRLPQVYPAQWKASKFAWLKRWHLIAMLVLSYLIMSTQVYSLFADNPPMANGLLLAYLICVSAYLLCKRSARIKKKRAKITNMIQIK